MVNTTELFIGIIIALIIWFLFYVIMKYRDKIKIRRLNKNYDKQEDASYQGEIKQGSFYAEGRGKAYTEGEDKFRPGDFGESPGFNQEPSPSGRSELPDVIDVARDEPAIRDDSKRIEGDERRTFRRRV